jgi:hypothetical protein
MPRIFIGVVGFWFWGAIREYPSCGIVEVVLKAISLLAPKAITFPSERFANGTAKLNGLDESVSITKDASKLEHIN